MTDFLSGLSPELRVFILAMLPMVERAALPLALTYYHLPWVEAFVLVALGNFLPVIGLVFGLDWLSQFLVEKSRTMKRFFNWLFDHTRLRHSKKFELWGALALIAFVAIPTPITGNWSGAVASFVFKVDKKKSLIYILAGIIIYLIALSIITLGITSLGLSLKGLV